MKKLTTKSFLALFGLMMFANMAMGQSCPPVSNLTATVNSNKTVKLEWTNPPESQWPSECNDLYFRFYDGMNEIGSSEPDNTTSWTTPVLSEGTHSLKVLLSYYGYTEYQGLPDFYHICSADKSVSVTIGGGSSCPPVTNLKATVNSNKTVTLNWTNPPSSQWPSGCTGDLYFKFFHNGNFIAYSDENNLTSWTTSVLSEGTHTLGVNLSYWGTSAIHAICYSDTVNISVAIANVNMNRWIELTVQQGDSIELDFSVDAENTAVKVESGTYDTTLTVGTTWTGFKNYYAQAGTMKVYGNVNKFDCDQNGSKITGLDASNNTGLTNLSCSNNNLSSLDITNLTALEALYCYNNNLSSLDLTDLTALIILNCFGNNLSSLDPTNLTALKYLNCFGNNLSACGLDSIFHQLPKRPANDKGEIIIKYDAYTNPGALSCRDTIATNRNWLVLDTDRGIPIVNTTYDCPYFTIGIEDIMVNNLEAEIYPNPASNLLNVISENANEIITISDLSGKIVYSEKASEKQTSINVSQLSAGMYIVRVGDKVTKFVKE